MALVVAGGLGNAIDRFTLGYVVDFIEPVFIDFPVFNVADIGVTCGFVLFVVAMILAYRRADREDARWPRAPGSRRRPDGAAKGRGSDDALALPHRGRGRCRPAPRRASGRARTVPQPQRRRARH